MLEMEGFLHKFFEHAPMGVAHQKGIFQGESVPEDFEFLEVNRAFERLTGLKASQVVGRKMSQVFPDWEDWRKNVEHVFQQISGSGGVREFQQFSPFLNGWFEIRFIPSGSGSFFTCFSDVSQVNELALSSEAFFQGSFEDIGFPKLTENARAISAARYAAFNLFEEDGLHFQTVAFSGPSGSLEKGSKFLGFPLLGKRWDPDPVRSARIKGKAVTHFSGLREICHGVISTALVSMLEKFFHTGEVVVACIEKDGKTLGDFTLIMNRGDRLQNEALLKSYAQQVGLLLTRSRAEKSLKTTEDLLGNVIRNVPGIVFRCRPDKDWTMEMISDETQTVAGYPASDFLQNRVRSFASIIHPEDRKKVREAIDPVVHEGKDYEVEYRICTGDGQVRWVHEKGQPVSDEAGNVWLDGVIVDISRRVEMEQDIVQQQMDLRTILETTQDGYCVLDLEGRIRDTNGAYCRMTGFSREEILQMNISDLELREDPGEIQAHVQRLATKHFEVFETRHRRKNGSAISLEIALSYLEKTPPRIICFVRDISQRKRDEEILEKNREFQALIMDMAMQFVNVSTSRVDVALQQLLQAIGEYARVDRAYIFQHDGSHVFSKNTHEWCAPGIEPQIRFLQAVPVEPFQRVMETMARGGVVHIPRLDKMEGQQGMKAILEPQGIQSLLFIPLMNGKENFGLVGFDAVEKQRLFSAMEIDLLRIAAQLIASVLIRQRAQKELDEHRAMLAKILDAIPQAVFWKDLQGEYMGCNPSFAKVAGLSDTSEVIGKTDFDLPWSHEEAEVIRADDREMLEKDVSRKITGTLPTADGSSIWIEIKKIPLRDKTGKLFGVLGVFDDITERQRREKETKESNERLQTILNGIDSPIYIADMQSYELLFANRTLQDAWGEELVGKSCWQVLQTGQSGPCPFCTNSLLLDKEGNPTGVYQWEFQNTYTKRWYECRDQAIRWVDGRMVRMEIATDITAHKQMEQQLILSRDLAQQATRAKSRFLSNMSHELRTPLNGILGFAKILLKESLSEEQKEYVKYIAAASGVLREVVGNILDFSKIEAHKMELQPQFAPLFEICNQVVQLLSFQSKQKHIPFSLDFDPGLPSHVLVDPLRLQQVLLNLTGNALKFTHEGHVTLRVFPVGQPSGEKVLVRFEVEDTGIGISPEEVQKIFQEFEQGDGSVTRKYGGTGLGLTIARSLLELMGTHLEVKSVSGEGSTFFFEVALEPRAVHSSTAPTLLVVDEDSFQRSLFKMMVRKTYPWAQVLEAGDVGQALRLFTQEHPQVVLLDLSLLSQNAEGVVQKFREVQRGGDGFVPLIALRQDGLRQTPRGMDGFLGKPVVPEDLLALLSRWRKT